MKKESLRKQIPIDLMDILDFIFTAKDSDRNIIEWLKERIQYVTNRELNYYALGQIYYIEKLKEKLNYFNIEIRD